MDTNTPLAERMRPTCLDDYVGQLHITGEKGILRQMVRTGVLSSFILWGPPGVGKTTLARIISQSLERNFFTLSAINAGVKDVRDVIEKAQKTKFFGTPNPILFIDEIHRFSKSQQDSLLGAVEKGVVTLIGATTENPSFEVIPALLSRCQVYVLQSMGVDELQEVLQRALTHDLWLSRLNIEIQSTNSLFRYSGGDARKLLNIIELVVSSVQGIGSEAIVVTDDLVTNCLQENLVSYDKNGEAHYDVISAFIKSIRGGDPDATVYWLARMLEGGEDIKFIARRMVISAAEDVGLANPNALLLANSCFAAVGVIGMPEALIVLSEVAIYLATSPKSNSAYTAIDAALEAVRQKGAVSVPLHLRNAPTKLMKQLGYGKEYQYPHAFPNNFVAQTYLPKEMENARFYTPQNNQQELKILERLRAWWQKRF
jgi:putative ATPase